MKTVFANLIFILFIIDTNAQCWQNVSSGKSHTIAIRTDGTLWSWGSDDEAELGIGIIDVNKNLPFQISKDSTWVQLSAGNSYSLAIKNDSSLWAWGANYAGEYGDGTGITEYSPKKIEGKWLQISAGNAFTVGIKSDSTLWVTGANYFGQLGKGFSTLPDSTFEQIGTDKWSQVAAGYYHTMALKSNGTLWGSGRNTSGQIGIGTYVDVKSFTQIGTDSNWVQVSTGDDFTLAIKDDGTLWGWGLNSSGQLGNGTATKSNIPVQAGTDNTWRIVKAGDNHTLGIKNDGSLWAWGGNNYGQLGDGTNAYKMSPFKIGNNKDWKIVSPGLVFSTTLRADGTLWSAGTNWYGQLGNGTFDVGQNTPFKLSCIPTSIEETLNQTLYNVFPNPTNSSWSIETKKLNSSGNYKVLDLLGNELSIGFISDSVTNIDATTFNKGIYFLEIQLKEAKQTIKLIKQ